MQKQTGKEKRKKGVKSALTWFPLAETARFPWFPLTRQQLTRCGEKQADGERLELKAVMEVVRSKTLVMLRSLFLIVIILVGSVNDNIGVSESCGRLIRSGPRCVLADSLLKELPNPWLAMRVLIVFLPSCILCRYCVLTSCGSTSLHHRESSVLCRFFISQH